LIFFFFFCRFRRGGGGRKRLLESKEEERREKKGKKEMKKPTFSFSSPLPSLPLLLQIKTPNEKTSLQAAAPSSPPGRC
jgi:hypothetical protein